MCHQGNSLFRGFTGRPCGAGSSFLNTVVVRDPEGNNRATIQSGERVVSGTLPGAASLPCSDEAVRHCVLQWLRNTGS
ncbi:rCG61581 [Rattus norvegicus]|uniref:RCG61581 n=1 Tax=Rattus norvegicus TaxID=10116 RepID=A6HB69_RAT|nr:rCG61581 [Rattus norvegicus]